MFYPRGLAQRLELRFAARMLPTIELNGSHYALQQPASYQAWHDETPADFQFAVKGPRYITHMLRLREARTPLANFFASGLFALGRKLGRCSGSSRPRWPTTPSSARRSSRNCRRTPMPPPRWRGCTMQDAQGSFALPEGWGAAPL